MSTFVWIVLIYVVAGIGLAITIWRASERRRVAWTTAFLAAYILIPFGDQFAGSLYVEYLCNTEAERRVFKIVDNVPGFLAKGRAIEPSKFDPYLFVEQEREDGSVTRLTMIGEGKISKEDRVPSISRYRYREGPVPVGLRTVKYERVIEDVTTGEVLAIEKRFNFKGGWAWHWMFHTYGTTQSCKGLPRLQGMIPEVLKPAPNPFLAQKG